MKKLLPFILLVATAVVFWRDGRLVVYGHTDAEGAATCEPLRNMLLVSFHGTTHCVKASGG